MKQLEHKEQATLIEWWKLAHKQFNVPECCLFAIPNGGARSATTGAMLKAEGVRAGVPDLCLAVARQGFHALFIEMKKAKGGVVSASQEAMCAELRRQGYAVEICHGWQAAMTVITRYLTGDSWLF